MSKKQKGRTQVKVALIGPMRYRPGWNYPQFHEVEAAWIEQHPRDIVINPAKNFDGDTSLPLSDYMQASCQGVLAAQFVVLLPEWEASEGATHEVALARITGKVFYQAEHDGADWWFARIDPPMTLTAKPEIVKPIEGILEASLEGFEGMPKADSLTKQDVFSPEEAAKAYWDLREHGQVRTFDSGATRDTEEDKLDFEAFLSPLVLESYAEYMHRHRKRSDDTLRAGDDWQKGMPRSVYMKSMWRHFMEVWSLHRAAKTCPADMADALNGVIFNAMGYLHEVELDRDLPSV